jgi:uncharacterized iron-regulated membrane protein
MKIEELFAKAWGWYKGLKTWKKVLGFLFLVVLAVLGIVYAVYRVIAGRTVTPTPAAVDNAHTAVVDNAIVQNRAAQRKLEADLMIKKSDAMTEVQRRVTDSGKQRDVRDLISKAKSFDEVDAVLKGLKR